MHAILLNIRHGGGLRAQSLLDWLTSMSPDVIVLPEWRDNASGALIQRGFETAGFLVTTLSRSRSNGILLTILVNFRSDSSSGITSVTSRSAR